MVSNPDTTFPNESETQVSQSRLGREDYLREGLAILEQDGPDHLRIDTLCRRLKATKGSFYHHFSNRNGYISAMLDFWEKATTQHLIEACETETQPSHRFERLLTTSLALPTGPEPALRAWAQNHPDVALAVARTDQQRLEYITGLCRPFSRDAEHAALLARIGYSVFVGAKHLAPPLDNDLLMRMDKELTRLFVRPLDSDSQQTEADESRNE
ncbi:MAG: TetR/AcrR family transcriptional regulator [Desulfovibrio sp.]|nr:MAG: TetR/AcrR family transcriptional regulator [Desulfovibrio sp.]